MTGNSAAIATGKRHALNGYSTRYRELAALGLQTVFPQQGLQSGTP
jgi:hypothetical protein